MHGQGDRCLLALAWHTSFRLHCFLPLRLSSNESGSCDRAHVAAESPQVVLIIEILHQFSYYLEAIVLIPQFVLLYKRQKYEAWVLLFTVVLGLEAFTHNLPRLMAWQTQQTEDPYSELRNNTLVFFRACRLLFLC